MKLMLSALLQKYSQMGVASYCILKNYEIQAMFLIGALLLSGGLAELSVAAGGTGTISNSEADFNDELIRNSVGNLFLLIEGAFGALIMVVAGLGAIVASAMGAYRAAVGMLVVAVGAFILRALVSLFFGSEYETYTKDT